MIYYNNINQLKYYRDSIFESLSKIESIRYRFGLIKSSDINKLFNLTEAYAVLCKTNNLSMQEADMFMRISERISSEYRYRNLVLNEGFENPFDDYDSTDDIKIRYDELCDSEPNDAVKIGGIRLWNDNTNGKIVYDNGRITAGKFFAVNDTIESCPVRLITTSDLYSRSVRDFAFGIDPDHGIYAIPFGYASFYRSNLDCNLEPNADYEYVDGPNKTIRIYATRPIRKGNEIVLQADREMFDNEFNDSQFRYDKEPLYSVKNVRVE